MLAIQSQTFYMPSSGIHSQTFSFTNTVKDFGVAMQGFEVSYGQESELSPKVVYAGMSKRRILSPDGFDFALNFGFLQSPHF